MTADEQVTNSQMSMIKNSHISNDSNARLSFLSKSQLEMSNIGPGSYDIGNYPSDKGVHKRRSMTVLSKGYKNNKT